LFQTLTPYLRLKSGTNSHAFEGFIPDLLQVLSRQYYINYTINLVPDGKYGTRDPNGIWNGMVGELTRGVR